MLCPSSQPVGSWWAAGLGLSAVSPLLEGFLVTLLAQPELGQCDPALPHPLGPLLEMTQTPPASMDCVVHSPSLCLVDKGRHFDLFFPSR